jgi:DNA-binding beta-propeller fold protein YncE
MKHFVSIMFLCCAVYSVAILSGCSSSKQAGKESELVWPSPPDQPRIKYIKTMHGEKDYESSLGALGRAITGSSDVISINSPFDICTDGQGRVWVTDAALGVFAFDEVKKEVTPLGEKSSIPLKDPRGVAYGDNKIFLGLLSLGQVLVLTTEGKDLYRIGKPEQFGNPVDVVYDSLKHRVIVVDNKLHIVSVFSENGDSLFTIGRRGTDDGEFNFPQSAAVDSQSNIYVVDAFNFRVEIFDSTGKFVRKFGQHGDAWGMFGRPKGIALDNQGNIYVSDASFQNIQVFNQQGELLLFVGKFSAGNDGFQDPVSITISGRTLLVADQLNKRIQVFQLLRND